MQGDGPAEERPPCRTEGGKAPAFSTTFLARVRLDGKVTLGINILGTSLSAIVKQFLARSLIAPR